MTKITLELVSGSKEEIVITWVDSTGAAIPLAGWSAKADFRLTASDAPVFTLTSASGITLDDEGHITLTISSLQSSQKPSVYQADVKVLAPTGGDNWIFVGRVSVKILETFTS